MQGEVIIIDTQTMETPKVGSNLYESRKNNYTNRERATIPEVSIYVVAYNRLDKTRYCIECILAHTKNVDYELILLDNGSTDGTLEFFESVVHPRKKIIRITKNIGTGFLLSEILRHYTANILVGVCNDVYVTENWLANILRCIKSDCRIGLVVPMSSNVSNLQDPRLNFKTCEEMQAQARLFNISNPKKWQERMRLVTPIMGIRREVLDTVGVFDTGFFHDFGEDDMCFRIRRAGYKMILLGDTFVHHDHNIFIGENKDSEVFRESLARGAQNFKDKHYGIDAWEDILNMETPLIQMLPNVIKQKIKLHLLGIDIRCGAPLLELKNYLRCNSNVQQLLISGFTTQAKYYADLQTVCNTEVACDRMDYLEEYFDKESVGCILLGEPINTYDKPIRIIGRLLALLEKGGVLLCKLTNTMDVRMLYGILGNREIVDKEMPIHISIDDLFICLQQMNIEDIKISAINHQLDENGRGVINTIFQTLELPEDSEIINRIVCKEYLLCIQK
ncbi:glycosyl transferase [Sporanaerobium hydrogeniformans]|uniref:Glycosyl transferase n=1 Tax=Sporanaerobium hydrogeniformans TaxID=3072179 RepID=A0AC61DEY7_9FIRM|nr:glycosyltransferase family 2 protein [Sporanaerobium hydrogeniformans]PHV71353.1 glycosyl transferase [Sporanaerobium hydrogeniformans]